MFNLFPSIKDYIDTYLLWSSITSDVLGSYAILMFFAILASLESHKPKIKWPRWALYRSYRTNLALLFFNNIVLSLLSVSSLYSLAKHSSSYGLLDGIAPAPVQTLLTFLLLDLMFYIWHKVSHSFDWMWQFHKLHHNDSYLNMTTAFRIHLVELFISCGLIATVIFITGANEATVLAYEAIMMFFVMFHHTNISFSGEKLLSLIFIVPNLHRVHHSAERSEHDNNYGAILSIWDRLFGTLKEGEPEKIGIKAQSPQTFPQILLPWKTPAIQSQSDSAKGTKIWTKEAMIAESAYYKAEKRGFSPGYELNDWIEAEREILRQIYAPKPLRNQNRSAQNFLKTALKINTQMLP